MNQNITTTGKNGQVNWIPVMEQPTQYIEQLRGKQLTFVFFTWPPSVTAPTASVYLTYV